MNKLTRRSFLQSTGKTGVGLTVGASTLASISKAGAAPASERVRLAIVGFRGRGGVLWRKYAARPDCEVAYLCDVDESLFATTAKDVEQIQNRRPQVASDFRRALDDKSIDAIVVATPDHWHALATIWGCQAARTCTSKNPSATRRGKAARWSKRHAATTASCKPALQNRSADLQPWCEGIHRQRQAGHHPHGPRDQPEIVAQHSPRLADGEPPAGLNWDMWTGPAPESKYNANYHRALESLLAFLRRRHHQRRRASDRPCPLARRQRRILNRSTPPEADSPSKACWNRPTPKLPSSSSTIWS